MFVKRSAPTVYAMAGTALGRSVSTSNATAQSGWTTINSSRDHTSPPSAKAPTMPVNAVKSTCNTARTSVIVRNTVIRGIIALVPCKVKKKADAKLFHAVDVPFAEALRVPPFTLSLSKGGNAVHGSTSSPRTVSDDFLYQFALTTP